ncbi:zinc-dependent metalloprotease [Flavobacterium sp. FlaQc-52]|jgi:hypothetical protein|uniref:zinc-dependent metalloprotease n=1 Tax=Flavobacterium sp. FlaQc-52 TaxID=3374185 RepID=UPI003756B8D6
MIKKITLIVFIFTGTFCYAQECLSDHYLKRIKSKNSGLENRIKKVISTFNSNEKNLTNKQLSAQEIIGEEIVVVPIVFNVIHNGEAIGTGRNIGQNKIDELVTIVNEAYSGKYGGVDTKIRFCLAKQNVLGQVTTGVNRFVGNASYDLYDINTGFSLNTDDQIKKNISAGFPNNLFLNIWIADLKHNGFNTLRGYSSFPFFLEDNPLTVDEDESIFNGLDGIVLDYLQVGINTVNPPDNTSSNGTAVVHEIGHWLGLFHIFQDDDTIECNETSCENQGDMICDTESVRESGITNVVASGNCLGNNCNGQTTTVVQNFMDYQSGARLYCRTKFTAGQKKRMRDIISFYRSSFYNQGTSFDLTACKSTSLGGGSSGTPCSLDQNLPVQRLPRPNIYQDFTHVINPSIKFGERFEVNDKWLVTVYDTNGYYETGTPKPPTMLVNKVVIYKREGCKYALHQMIDLELSNLQLRTDFGLLLNGDEIIVTSSILDEVYIYRLNESSDMWSLVQQIKNNSSDSEVGNSVYTIGKFLFILERSTTSDNIFRVYYKNNVGTYVFHQNIAIQGFSLPTLGKFLQSGNFIKKNVDFNSDTFTGSYDPPEILVSRTFGVGLVLLELGNNNMWSLASTIQPVGMSSAERTLDIELSKDFIYILTSAHTEGTPNEDVLYFYSYRVTDRSGSNFPFQNIYTRQAIVYNPGQIYSDTKMQLFNDQFLLIDNIKYISPTLFYNLNYGSGNFPNWEKRTTKIIGCSNPSSTSDDFEVFGNLLYYGNSEYTINVYNMSDILKREGFDQTFIDNSDFYNKKINIIPDNHSTSAQKITIGESGKVEFNYVEKEFIANNSIVLKPGTTLARGSTVNLKITDIYGLCNSIVTSKKSTDQLDLNDDHLNVTESENSIKPVGRVSLSPNPNNGVFTIYSGAAGGKQIDCVIYDSTGKEIFSESTDKSIFSVNLPYLPAGVYLIKLTGDNYKETIKFIKQ